ncbi:IS110 family transposase [Kocuria marina]|uniref:IS110 family transposase n=1 Tax=Kocuria marina TaxID=223184 RepID=UPI0030B90AAC
MCGGGPSKLQRSFGDRVKTDAKDAVHLARLLRVDEVTGVVVPSVEQEAVQDLVRAREGCRSDLMRARHRVSKLLLHHGIVYEGGAGLDRGPSRVAGPPVLGIPGHADGF